MCVCVIGVERVYMACDMCMCLCACICEYHSAWTFCYIQDGNTALLRACLNDHLEVARQLCQGRPDINVNTPNKVSQASMYASFPFSFPFTPIVNQSLMVAKF